jgi:hypothetical protein
MGVGWERIRGRNEKYGGVEGSDMALVTLSENNCVNPKSTLRERAV